MKANELGFIEHGTGKHQSNIVWDISKACPAITTLAYGGTQQIKVLVHEKVSDSSLKRAGFNRGGREQRLEISMDGCSNAITSVAKDNYVIEYEEKSNMLPDTNKLPTQGR